MKTRKYKDGETLFAAGEPSDSAYIVQSGRVDLFRQGGAGPVLIGSATADDLIGEMGLLDNSPRDLTARASGAVVVKVLPRREFLRRIEEDPATAMTVMAKLAQRLRETDDRLTLRGLPGGSAGPAAPASAPSGETGRTNLPVPVDPGASTAITALVEPRKGSLIGRLFGRWRSSRGEGRDGARPFTVLVAPLGNDPEDTQRPHLLEWLGQLEGFTARAHGSAPLPAEGDALLPGADRLRRADAAARRWLAEQRADLVIWGEVDAEGRMNRLHFTAATLDEEVRPGRPLPLVWLPVPCYFDESWGPLFQAIVMAAVEPRGDTQAQMLAQMLPGWLEAARVFIDHPVEGLYQVETAQIFASYGLACAAAGDLAPATGLQDYAAEVLKGALDWMPEDEGAAWYGLQRQVAVIHQAIGERSGSPDHLHAAAESYRHAIQGTERAAEPVEWAGLHMRLGTVLFRLDMAEGNVDALREAIGTLQQALTVYTRQNFPWQWAEVMHTVNQVLQVYGDQHKSREALERAVAAAREALTVRDRAATPLLWAASRNGLGTALFLLAKHTKSPHPLPEALECLDDAIRVYGAHAMPALVRIATRNRERADTLLRRLGGPPPPA